MASYYNSAGSKVTVIEMLDYMVLLTEKSVIFLKEYQKRVSIQAKLKSNEAGAGLSHI